MVSDQRLFATAYSPLAIRCSPLAPQESPHRLRRAAAYDGAPDDQEDHRADDGADEAGPLPGLIPADLLAEPGGDKRADDAEDGGENEPARLVRPADEQLGNNAGAETDKAGPDDVQGVAPGCRRPLA